MMISHTVSIASGTCNFCVFKLNEEVKVTWLGDSKSGGSTFANLFEISEPNSTSMNVYPNPVINTLTIEGSKGASLGILDTQGVVVASDYMETENTDVSNLP